MFQLAAPATHEIEIKKSRFIGHLVPVTSRAEAMRVLAELRNAHESWLPHYMAGA